MWIEPTGAGLDEAIGLAARELYRRDLVGRGLRPDRDELARMWDELPAWVQRSHRSTAAAVAQFFIDAARHAQAEPTGKDFS